MAGAKKSTTAVKKMPVVAAAAAPKSTSNPDEPKKKKIRESKNRKKYWKKADVSEVEEFLETQRFHERVGGDVSLREDSQLFLVDKSTDDVSAGSETRSCAKKKSDILKEPLRCHAILEERSKVAVPYTKSRVKTEDERKSAIHLEKERTVVEQRVRQSQRTAEHRQQTRLAKQQQTKCRTLNSQTELFDLWEGQVKKPKVQKTETGCHLDVLEAPEDAEMLSGDQLAYYARVTRSSRPKVPQLRYKKPSKLPAVEVAKPGASYQPTKEDHQELLAEAHEVEVVKLKQEEHLERVLTSLFPTEERAREIRVQNKKEEAVGILYSDDDDNEDEVDDDEDGDEGEEEGDELATGNPRVLAENRKTRVQRNRAKAHKERLKAAAAARVVKKFETQIGRIGVFKKQIQKAGRVTRKRIAKRLEKEAAAEYQPKHIGRQKFRPQDVEIKLSDELPSTLRQLKPEGSIMKDRMRSLEKRNLVEPRRKTMRKKKWTKKVYKRSYKKGFEDVLTAPKVDGVV